ncbi:calnexin 1 [Hibiscus trionum]|uniref:Calnexin 1 n=1 Tax=Hibiscus trionum TaxID=183268 RepID=A0A9W7LK81_HIBTR|nr:calnexin 1 [Hibiscus trionum]
MIMGRFALLLFLAFSSLQLLCFAADDDDAVFYDSFEESFDGRWIVSDKDDYKGVWKHSKSEGHDDYGLLVSEKARKYAIVKELDEPVSLKEGTAVLQFETRFQNGLECGGAYLKYLRPQEAGWKPKEFDNESPYAIMFGPDKCGLTNKVHFILKHKNPKSGEYVEHHLGNQPTVPSDKLTHVYTAILRPNNEVRILVDGEEKAKANFLSAEDFDPPLIPSKTIPDPVEKKPKDWDDKAKFPDPSAVKPDDWDEDAPMEIEDKEAVKPEGWLDNEPEEIDDPEASKPDDWDEEEDGEWEAPKIDNPKCATAPGCGEWKRPMKPNPDFKGRWHPPLIDNPNYKGIWKPRDIPNPKYFELDKPDFELIAAIGIEIWTMQDGILFDNILIAKNEKVAKSYRDTQWMPKFEIEKKKQKAEEADGSYELEGLQKKVFDVLYKVADIPFLSEYKLRIIDFIERAETQPNLTIGLLVSVVVLIITILFMLISGGKKQPKVEKKTEVAEASNDQGSSGEKGGEGEESKETGGAPRRRRRET